jgi:hypothetical protein
MLKSKKILTTRKERVVYVLRFNTQDGLRSIYHSTYWKLNKEQKESFKDETFSEGLRMKNSPLQEDIGWVIGEGCFHTFTTFQSVKKYIKANQIDLNLLQETFYVPCDYVICKAIIPPKSRYLHGTVEITFEFTDSRENIIKKTKVHCPAVVTEKLKLIEVLNDKL